jgi:hypothetical protein
MTMKAFDVSDTAGASQYVKRRLAEGKSLSRAASVFIDIWPCQYSVLLDSDQESPNYERGGVCKSRASAIVELASILCQEVAMGDNSLVFEHALAEKGDSWIENVDQKPIYYGNDVYFTYDETNCSHSAVEQLIRIASTAQGFTAFVVSKTPGKELDEDLVRNLFGVIQTLRMLVVGVYDNETFLLVR